MVQQQRAAATHDAIIRGAAGIFAQQGYGDASLSEISKQAGVTKGALYFHYPSKETLAIAVVEEQHRIATESGAAIRALNRPALETLIRILRSFSDLLLADVVMRAGIRLTFEASAFNADVTNTYKDWGSEFEVLIRDGMHEGDISTSVDPSELSWLIVGSYTGVQMVSNVLSERAGLLAAAASMCTYLLPSIVAPPRLDLIPGLMRLWE